MDEQLLSIKNQLVIKILYRASEFACSCEHGNEPLGSIKAGECLD
jgi:hypothetical protein